MAVPVPVVRDTFGVLQQRRAGPPMDLVLERGDDGEEAVVFNGFAPLTPCMPPPPLCVDFPEYSGATAAVPTRKSPHTPPLAGGSMMASPRARAAMNMAQRNRATMLPACIFTALSYWLPVCEKLLGVSPRGVIIRPDYSSTKGEGPAG